MSADDFDEAVPSDFTTVRTHADLIADNARLLAENQALHTRLAQRTAALHRTIERLEQKGDRP